MKRSVKQHKTGNKNKTKGSWDKGQSGNPHGRPKSPEIELFRQALKVVEKKQGLTLLEHAVKRAYVSDVILVALLKKMLPDKVALTDNEGNDVIYEILDAKKSK